MAGESLRGLKELLRDQSGSGKPEDKEDAEDKAGMSAARGMIAGVTLVRANGDLDAIYYGSMARVRYDRSVGVIFKFADVDGSTWEVTIHGNNLEKLFRDLALCRRESIRINGETVLAIEVKAEGK
jgi:hypothetical protein